MTSDLSEEASAFTCGAFWLHGDIIDRQEVTRERNNQEAGEVTHGKH